MGCASSNRKATLHPWYESQMTWPFSIDSIIPKPIFLSFTTIKEPWFRPWYGGAKANEFLLSILAVSTDRLVISSTTCKYDQSALAQRHVNSPDTVMMIFFMDYSGGADQFSSSNRVHFSVSLFLFCAWRC